jgi:sugar phosphate isomerase/epimerase
MSTRRSFLKRTSLASAGLFISKADFFKDHPLVGLQLYTVRKDIAGDVSGTVAKVAKIGYTSVEVFGYNNGKFFGLTPEQFLAIIKQNNLVTPSGHYSMSNFLLKGDVDELNRTVADAAKMGHEFFVVPYLTDNMRTSLDDYKKLALNLNKAAEVTKSAGMQLAYHNHNFEFLDWGGGQTGFGILEKETDAKLVNFEMDIYWVSRAGIDPIQLIKSNPKRIKLWHIKDMTVMKTPSYTTDGSQLFTEVGTGVINYKEIFKYKKESGMKYFFVEQDQTTINVYDSITKSLAYIQQDILGYPPPANPKG